MVNDDILIKWVRNVRGFKTDWPEYVIQAKKRLHEAKLGFPGIGNNHISLVKLNQLEVDDIFIWDLHIESLVRCTDEAPLALRKLNNKGKYLIEGIGVGIDSVRDPDRTKFRWMDEVVIDIGPEQYVWRIDVRPDLIKGGPGYYYFYRSYRDFRV